MSQTAAELIDLLKKVPSDALLGPVGIRFNQPPIQPEGDQKLVDIQWNWQQQKYILTMYSLDYDEEVLREPSRK